MTIHTIQIEVPDGTTEEQVHEDLCLALLEGNLPDIEYIVINVLKEQSMKRHPEHRLGGVVEAALNFASDDENWLIDMSKDTDIEQNTTGAVFRAVESYLTDALALIAVPPIAYMQDADGNEETLLVTEPDPADGTFCVHMDDQRQSWIRIVPQPE